MNLLSENQKFIPVDAQWRFGFTSNLVRTASQPELGEGRGAFN